MSCLRWESARLPTHLFPFLVLILVLCTGVSASAGTRLELISNPEPGVVQVSLDGPVRISSFRLSEPDRQVFDLENVTVSGAGSLDIPAEAQAELGPRLERVRWAQYQSGFVPVARVVLDLTGPTDVEVIDMDLGLTLKVQGLPSDRRPIDQTGAYPSETLPRAQAAGMVTPSQPLLLATEPLGYDAVPLEPLLGPATEVDSGEQVAVIDGPADDDGWPIETKGLETESSFQADTLTPEPQQGFDSEAVEALQIASLEADSSSSDYAPRADQAIPVQVADGTGSGSDSLDPVDESQNWIVRIDGKRIRLREPWRIEGKRVVFTTHKGVLASMRLSDVDLDASR